MNGQHLHVQPCRRGNGLGDRIRDIVEFEVKKYGSAGLAALVPNPFQFLFTQVPGRPAPIFDVAHYGIAADLFDLVPALTEKIKANG